jgi:ABC-2 type transport system permease protein
MRNIWTIAKREYKAFFSSFTAYLFAFVTLLVVGIVVTSSVLYTIDSFGQAEPPSVQVVVGPVMFLLVFACPAFSMRLLSEEQRLGTMELLLTAPVRDIELVIGKWLGSFLFVITLIAVTWIYPITLNIIISPGIDQGLLLAGYLGLVLVAGVFLAIGVAVSSFFSNQVASYIITFGVIVIFWWIFGILGQVSSGSELLSFLDMGTQFYDVFYRGIIDLAGLVYLLSLMAVSLLIGSVSIETRRWG